MVELTILIPTYNEEDYIEEAISGIYNDVKKLKISFEMLVIDDSIDSTSHILRKLERKFRNIRVVHRFNKKGVGSATRLGIEKAKGKYVIVYMSDALEDTVYILPMLKKLRQGYDIVQTSRFFKESRWEGYPIQKRIGNWLCNNFIRLIFFRSGLNDFTSLFKGFNNRKIRMLNLGADVFDLGLEITLKGIRKGYKITEVPVSWKERKDGKSKFKLSKYAMSYFRQVIRIWLFYHG